MDRIERYIEQHSSGEGALLAELERATNLRVIQPKMVSGRAQGAFLRLVTAMVRPQIVLEIGTFTGYSALSIAAGFGAVDKADAEDFGAVEATKSNLQLPQLHTVEVDDELEDIARSFFARSPWAGQIHLHIGSALEVVPRLFEELGRPFDLVFIDGDKREYPDYWRMLMGEYGASDGAKTAAGPMLHSGSIVLADNVLWYGKVAEADSATSPDQPEIAHKKIDSHTAGIVEFNRLVAADRRVENVILPLRDGINMIRVK